LTYDFNVVQGNFTLNQPTFTLFPTKDPVADWEAFAAQIKASSFLTNQRNTVSACFPLLDSESEGMQNANEIYRPLRPLIGHRKRSPNSSMRS